MKKVIVLILALCFAAPICGAQQNQIDLSFRTNDLLNGRWWRDSTQADKVNYVAGFFVGLAVTFGGTDECIKYQALIQGRYQGVLNFGEIIDEVDAFYKESANAPLPIRVAIEYQAQKSKGTSKMELDQIVTKYRRHYFELMK